MKRRTYLALFLTLMLSGGIVVFDTTIFSTPVTAESFQSSQSVSFTFNPTVSITVSGDLVIESLTPGDYKDSNVITVTATSNAIAGYTLSGTVGNSTHSSPSFNNTNLNHTNGTNTFTNLSTNKTSLSDFDENSNTWGYSWCSGTCTASTETTSWVSGNVGSTTQGYNGLPIYTTDSPIQFINSTSSDSSTISFKIGARSTTTQIAGEYTNVINFIGVGRVVTTNYTIDFNSNSGSSVSSQTGSTNSSAVQISSTVPTLSDYIFKGWCTADNSSSPTTCSGDTIQPGNFLALNTTASTYSTTLYAIWESNSAS